MRYLKMATKAIIATPSNEIEDLVDILINHNYDKLLDKYKFDTIQVNSDGYPDNIIPRLNEILKKRDITFITAGGNIRSLRDEYDPNPLGFHSMDYPQSNVSIVLARDNHDESVDKSIYQMKTIKLRERKEKYPFTDYIYIVDKNNKIYCSSNIHKDLNFMEGCDFKEE